MNKKGQTAKKTTLFLWITILLLGFSLSAQDAVRDTQEEQKLYDELKEKSLDAAELFKSATQALDQGNNDAAEGDYRKVLVIVPDYVPALRRLSYVVRGKDEALALARKAYNLDKHHYNKKAFIEALLRCPEKYRADDAEILVRELMTELPGDVDSYLFLSKIAIKKDDLSLFKSAVAGLRNIAPDAMETHYMSAIEARIEERWEDSKKEINRAVELGLPPEAAQEFLEKSPGENSPVLTGNFLKISLWVLAAWIIILVLLMLTGMILSKITLSSIEKQDPGATKEASEGEKKIQSLYSLVLGITSIYFYLSIPIVMILVLAVGGGIIYGFYSAGRIPIKLTAIIGLLTLATIWSMLKSLFYRPKTEDPGQRLTKKEAPQLFAVLKEVAKKVNAPMIDTLFLATESEIAVYEQGSLFKRLLGKTEKCMILGLGALKGMTQLQLKSILAHEFGHISNRDTSGGSLSLHVRRSILISINEMAISGSGRWYNPAWIFMNSFYRVFLRISHGASRLQEVMADRFAALAYGANTFAKGLSHVIRRSIEFNMITQLEVYVAEKEKRAPHNFYAMEVPANWPEDESQQAEDGREENKEDEKKPPQIIEEQYEEAMKTPTSPYDSHPAPKKRIEWINRLKKAPLLDDDNIPALELIDAPMEFQVEMTKKLHEEVKAHYMAMAIAETETE